MGNEFSKQKYQVDNVVEMEALLDGMLKRGTTSNTPMRSTPGGSVDGSNQIQVTKMFALQQHDKWNETRCR